jgi:hypothetical protein
MFKVSYESRPDDPEFANAPDTSQVFDTEEDASAFAATVRENGGRVTEDYEMSESECVHFNMNCHSHGW